LVVDGNFDEFSARGRPRKCGPARLIFHPAAEVHANQFGIAGGRCFNVELGTRLASRLLEVDCEARFGAHMPAASSLLASRLYDELCAPVELTPLVVEGLALALIGELDRAGDTRGWQTPAWLSEVVEHIDGHFRERLSVEELSSGAGVHPTHLSRTFGRNLGVTIGEYVRFRRVAWSWHQIVHTTRPLSEIALEGGFADQAHFARVFKQVTRTTPRQLRQTLRPRSVSLTARR
jgi:AraC family transcriptional regulator